MGEVVHAAGAIAAGIILVGIAAAGIMAAVWLVKRTWHL